MILGVTGHRPEKLGGYGPSAVQQYVRGFLSTFLKLKQPERVITGMALGFDTWVAETCVELKIPFTAAIPFDKQEQRWSRQDQDHYWDLVREAELVHYISKGAYCDPALYQKRNEWVVDNSDALLACWDGSRGGTANCVRYAKKVKRTLYRIDPRKVL